MKLINYLHQKLYGYPTRSEVRLALQKNMYSSSFSWRVGMLYVCGEDIEKIANHFEINRERVRMILNKLVREG